MEKKGKYLLGLFCALALALGFMWPEAANAETTLPEEVAHTSHDGWTELTAETRILASGSKYYLTSDVVLNKQLICNSNVILCLNGYELTVKDVLKGGIKIPKGAALTICDCRPEAPQDVFKSPATGETVTVNGGRIRGSQCTDGIIYVDGGSLTIYGGSVVGNANRGINIVLGTFIMNGGAILHNKGGSGAGVQVSGGSFTMNGGIISNNESTGDGGGVQLTGSNPQLTLAGGTISNNTAMKNGGGVYVSPVSFSLSGDMVIKDNSATGNGKNVYFFNINDDKAINIGQLKNTVPISMYIYNQIKFTNGWSASMGSADPARYFTSENTKYNILSDGVELYMTKHSHSWETSWQSADGYHWHNCSAEGCFITENIGKDGYGAHVGSDDGDCTTMLKCTTCDVEMIAAKEHSFGTSPSNKVATAATCTEVATYYVKCDNENCSQVSSAKTVSSGTVDPDAHKPAEDWTQEGDKHYHACENGCDAHLDEADCSGGTATCAAKAVCSVCSNEYGSVDANNHAWSTAWSSDDTHHWHECTNAGCPVTANADKDGYATHTPEVDDGNCTTPIQCSVCNAVTTAAKTSHSFNEKPSDRQAAAATCTAPATYYVQCDNCSAVTKEKTIAQGEAAGHAWSSEWSKDGAGHWYACTREGCVEKNNAATHTPEADDGDCTTAIRCSVCDWVTTLARDKHSFTTKASQSVAAEATCTEATIYYVQCDNCKTISQDKKVAVGEALGHSWTSAWSSDDTHHWHECVCEGCALQDKAQMDGYGAHSYDNAFDATCNTCGYKRAVSVPIVTPPSYDITLPSIDHGTIAADAKSARKGELVTITAVPDEGFALDTLTVTDQRGKTVALTDNDDESFSFIMPSGRITIEATFTEIVPEAPVVFVDAREGDWFYSDVVFVSERGLMVGVDENHFAPHKLTSRAMLVTVLYRLEGEPAAERSGFSDVAEDAWYSGAVAWAEENGIVSGHTDGTFAPNAAMSREQMATILYRYACVKGYDTSARADLSGYNDQDDISTYAKEALSWCKAVGIVGGVNETTLSPQSGAERAQVAAMLHRFIERFQA